MVGCRTSYSSMMLGGLGGGLGGFGGLGGGMGMGGIGGGFGNPCLMGMGCRFRRKRNVEYSAYPVADADTKGDDGSRLPQRPQTSDGELPSTTE
ncbi:unnamed protein product [Soboliphyme baturini]|uniref:Uncharacterized protein n=1 Tax=Soboliphyme baturini TaxID=241478 RepID=A0A183IF02_9BILA|nr:unnamed protein product [Soboliphyme baturini]